MNTKQNKAIECILEGYIGSKNYERHPIEADASSRHYERISRSPDSNLILMVCENNDPSLIPFISIAKYLSEGSFSAPSIYAQDIDNGLLVLEDLGDLSYNKAIKAGYCERDLYKAAVDTLLHLHSLPLPNIPKHSEEIMEKVERFIKWYSSDIENLQQEEFFKIWNKLLKGNKEDSVVCLYDYHADNLMWLEERSGFAKVGLLDFQDAVVGSDAIDLVALLQDVRRDVTQSVQEEMIKYFVSEKDLDFDTFYATYCLWGAHWNTRILGTFARLSKRDGKHSYLDFIPTVWNRLEKNLEHPSLNKLKKWFDRNFSEEDRYGV